MDKSILLDLDNLNNEMEDVAQIIEKTEKFRKFSEYLQEHHIDSNVVCEINKYKDLLSIDVEGTIIKADGLLQIRYIDSKKSKKK